MSLADELLADLEDTSDEIKELIKQDNLQTTEKRTLRNVAKLLDSCKIQSLIDSIDKSNNNDYDNITLIEQHPIYKLVVSSSNLTSEISLEIEIIHKYICEMYRKRFPELESLVLDPFGYILTAKTLGNDVDKAKSCGDLLNFLNQATIMIVSVSASTTQGTDLSTDEINTLDDACEMTLKLNNYQERLFQFIESKMTFIAPNLTSLLGASVAAKLIGVAGGLTTLSKMPACNVLVLGANRKFASAGMFSTSKFAHYASATVSNQPDKMKVGSGFANAGVASSNGLISQSDLVQSCAVDIRSKISRLVACKCSLAARVDSCHSYSDGSEGSKYRNHILQRISKLEEPPPVKQIKPLPPPIDPTGKRRGGRRARKMKERLGLTEIRKQANRMTFGAIEQDAYQDDLGLSLGQIGKSGAGRVRSAQIDAKTKVRISQKLQKYLQKDRQVYGGQTTTRKAVSGTASTVAFTPLQGLEIVSAAATDGEKTSSQSNENAKYFSNRTGFLKVQSVIPKHA